LTGPAWDDISPGAKTLVTKMLKRNPDHRISVSDILEHPWLVDEAPDIDFNRDYFTRIKHLALRNKMKTFFLESSLLEGHTKRRKSLRAALPIFKQASDVALLSSTQFEELDQREEVINEVKVFHSKMKVLKNMVVSSISGNLTEGRKEIDYITFTGMLKECHLQELCSLQVFNIFDIGNTGTIDPREFLLTMLAFRTDKPIHNMGRVVEKGNEDDETSISRIEMSPTGKKPEEISENEEEIRLFFNVFDIKETGYIDLEELKIAVNFLLYMGSDQPQTLPNIHELFSIIDVAQNGRIEYPEFKQFYKHLIASHISLQNN
jgi:Ca2+-binding EF-hand superfamily protein